tara:strand:- start:3462 stop:3743 length:282 start_codon:yes stop_codon:yes gene_type:complete
MTYFKFKVTEEGYTETGWDSQGNQESYQFIADPNSYAKRIAQVIQNNQKLENRGYISPEFSKAMTEHKPEEKAFSHSVRVNKEGVLEDVIIED